MFNCVEQILLECSFNLELSIVIWFPFHCTCVFCSSPFCCCFNPSTVSLGFYVFIHTISIQFALIHCIYIYICMSMTLYGSWSPWKKNCDTKRCVKCMKICLNKKKKKSVEIQFRTKQKSIKMITPNNKM